MRRFSRKQWYAFHLQRYQDAEKAVVDEQYGPLLARAKQAVANTSARLKLVRSQQPISSRLLGVLGVDTEYLTTKLRPMQAELEQRQAHFTELWDRRRKALIEAERRGELAYEERRGQRKEEMLARQERVEERAHQRRIRYLERSPAIRSAARFLKQVLLQQFGSEEGNVTCHYCGAEIRGEEAHLEHKRPVTRGGDNRLQNLTLACAACNLSKGRKTEEEFLRAREEDAWPQ